MGFIVAAQFLSLERLEIPYYIVMLGTATLIVYGRLEAEGAFEEEPVLAAGDWRDVPDETTRKPTDSFGLPGFGVMN